MSKIILEDSDIAFLKKHFADWEELISSDDINMVLDRIHDLMMMKGFDENDDINDFGIEAERVYDNIFYNN